MNAPIPNVIRAKRSGLIGRLPIKSSVIEVSELLCCCCWGDVDGDIVTVTVEYSIAGVTVETQLD